MAFQDILSMLQRANVFAPQNTASQEENDNQSAVNPSIANNLYQPSNAAATAYLNAAQNIPDIRDYQPSRLRKIGAVIAGLGTGRPVGMYGGQPVGFEGNPNLAQKTTESALYAPYDIELQNAEERLKPLQAASELENQENSQERLAASLAVRTNQGDRRLDQADERLKLTKESNDIKNKYYHDRGSKIETDSNGKSIMVFSDGSTKLLDGIMSPVEVKQVEAQKNYDLQLRNEIEVAKKKGDIDLANRLTELQQQFENAIGLQHDKTAGEIEVKQTPGVTTNETQTVTDKNGRVVGERKTTKTQSGNVPLDHSTANKPQIIGPDGKPAELPAGWTIRNGKVYDDQGKERDISKMGYRITNG